MANEIMSAEEAREYIAYFNKHVATAQITFVDTKNGKRIVLSDMSDEETIFVANGLKDIEIQAAKKYNGGKQ